MYIGVSSKVHVWIITTSIPKWKVHYSVRGGNIYIFCVVPFEKEADSSIFGEDSGFCTVHPKEEIPCTRYNLKRSTICLSYGSSRKSKCFSVYDL